jgi:hypothetical protein
MAGDILVSNNGCDYGVETTENLQTPWWEWSWGTLVLLIFGLPIIGLLCLGILTMLGFDVSNLPAFASYDFFIMDFSYKLISLPFFYLIYLFFNRK